MYRVLIPVRDSEDPSRPKPVAFASWVSLLTKRSQVFRLSREKHHKQQQGLRLSVPKTLSYLDEVQQ